MANRSWKALKLASPGLHWQDWVVYAKSAFGGPMQVLRYLGRYTHHVAISNHRLLTVDGEHVTFRGRTTLMAASTVKRCQVR